MGGERAKSFRDWLMTNQGVGVVLALLLGAYLVYLQLSPWVHTPLRDGFKLGFFPMAGVALMLLFAAALVFDGRRGERLADLASLSWKRFLFCVLAVVGAWVYLELLQEVGFLLVSPVYLVIFMGALGMRPWRDALLAGLVITALVYVIFRLLGIQLPPGILPL